MDKIGQKTAETHNQAIFRVVKGGVLAGAGAFAMINGIRHLHQLQQDAKKSKKGKETDAGTIVLTLPKRVTGSTKRAEKAEKAEKSPDTAKAPETAETTEVDMTGGPGEQARDEKGRFVTNYVKKTKDPEPGGSVLKAGNAEPRGKDATTITLSMLGGIGGGALGVVGVNKLYDTYREMQLKKRLRAAKHEYMDLLSGNVEKPACMLSEILGCDDVLTEISKHLPDGEKRANNDYSTFDKVLGSSAMLFILGTLGTAYITKRVMDERTQEAANEGYKPPELQRIIFRTEQDGKMKKRAADVELEAVHAGLAIMLDKIGCTTRFVGHPSVKAVMPEGMTEATLLKMADGNFGILRNLLSGTNVSEQLAGLVNKYSDDHPLKKWLVSTALKTEWGKQYAKDKMDGAIKNFNPVDLFNSGFLKSDAVRKGISTVGNIAKSFLPGSNPTPNKGTGMFNLDGVISFLGYSPASGKISTASAEKAGSVGGIVAGLAGFDMLADNMDHKLLARLVVEEQERRAKEKSKPRPPRKTRIEFKGADPAAEAYIAKNHARIAQVVKRLASQGTA